MKYPYSFLLGLLGWLLAGCQSIEPLSIDYLIPAEVSFPSELKRVAVVNNMSAGSGDYTVREEVAQKDETGVTFKTQRFPGLPALTAEALAEGLSEGNYFEQVVICDSALRAHDKTPRREKLTRDEIQRLTEGLGVDFLIALEDVHFVSTRKVTFSPYYQAFLGLTDLKAYPTVSIYLPQRNGPTATLQASDSIFWETLGTDLAQTTGRLIAQKDLLNEASEFAGSLPVKKLLPHWRTGQRYLYTGGSALMRDAMVYVRESNWPEAIRQWEQLYEQNKGMKKMQAAHNLAVGYEMQDRIPEALAWAQKAQKLAVKPDYHALASFYVAELEKRKSDLHLLNVQMERFKE